MKIIRLSTRIVTDLHFDKLWYWRLNGKNTLREINFGS
jgi:hypothetical protein